MGTKQKYIAQMKDQRRHTPILVQNINTSSKQTTQMLQKAISSGSRHGLELKAGKLDAANWDFLFQAIIHNIENMPCYTY